MATHNYAFFPYRVPCSLAISFLKESGLQSPETDFCACNQKVRLQVLSLHKGFRSVRMELRIEGHGLHLCIRDKGDSLFFAPPNFVLLSLDVRRNFELHPCIRDFLRKLNGDVLDIGRNQYLVHS